MRSLLQLLRGVCRSPLVAAAWLLLLTACAGTETGNPPAATDVVGRACSPKGLNHGYGPQ